MSRSASREEGLFADALALPPTERGAYLAKACGADVDLLAHLVALVAAHEGSETLLRGSHLGRVVGIQAAPPRESLQDEGPGDSIGRYKLLQKIGEGGCGVVWMAEQEEPVRRRVALKIIKLGMDTKAVVARFEAERQALAMMDHPCIAKVHDAGSTETGRPYFVMELVRGIPITRYCDENHLTPTARLELFIKVCQAIQHAHQKGVIHRDIKPSNILVTVNDGAPTPKVIDFGIAKATQGKLTDATVFTAFEQFIGTPVYMSPEQAEMSSLDIDTRSDIYSLGVLLYELLTGRPPFDPRAFAQAGVDQIRRQIREVEPPRPSARLRTLEEEERTTIARLRGTAESQLSLVLRGDLDWIVMRCIEKDRTRRYDTANGLALDLQRYLRNEPVVARPPSTGYLFQKLVRRHRLAFAAAALIAVSLVLGAAISTWQAVRATNAEREQLRLRADSDRARVEAIAARNAEQAGRLRAEAAGAAAREAALLAAAGRASAEDLISFVLTELAEQLDEWGLTQPLRHVSERLIAYYEALPPGLQTRDTRTSYAFALVGVNSLGRWRNNERPDLRGLKTAVAIVEELETMGSLTAFERVTISATLASRARWFWEQVRHEEAANQGGRQQEMLRPALADAKWGPWAQRAFAAAVRDRAYYLMRSRNFAESIVEFEHALAAAAETDRRLASKRPGLRAADVEVDYSEVLWLAGRREDARSVTARAERSLREFARREPHLAGVRMQLARLARNLRNQAWPQWKFKEVIAALDEQESEYGHVLSRDAGNVDIHGLLAGVCVDTSSRFACAWREGDFAAAEVHAKRGVEHAQKPAAIPFWQTNLITAHLSWARVCAATGRNRETEHQLSAAEQVARQLAERTTDPASAVIYWANFETRRRDVEMERLNWREVADNAGRSLDRLLSLETRGDTSRITNAVQIAHRDLMRAALETGDYAAARRELDGWLPQFRPLNQTGDIFPRFSRLGDALLRIEVLARAGGRQVATTELEAIWPEVEQVFASGPDYLFNRIQTARALAVRAELEPDAARKRVWLERASRYLQPAAAAGRLTRYEREMLLAGIDRQLSSLPGNAP